MQLHPTVRLDFRGEPIDIDEELAPLITEIWRAELETIDCCQDLGEAAAPLFSSLPHLEQRAEFRRASIRFTTPDDLCSFYEALANSGPRDAFYVRMVHWTAPSAWRLVYQLDDLAVEDAEAAGVEVPPVSQFCPSEWVAVTFARSDIPEMTRRMRVFNTGNLPAPGPVDWSTVEISDGSDSNDTG